MNVGRAVTVEYRKYATRTLGLRNIENRIVSVPEMEMTFLYFVLIHPYEHHRQVDIQLRAASAPQFQFPHKKYDYSLSTALILRRRITHLHDSYGTGPLYVNAQSNHHILPMDLYKSGLRNEQRTFPNYRQGCGRNGNNSGTFYVVYY